MIRLQDLPEDGGSTVYGSRRRLWIVGSALINILEMCGRLA